MTTWLLALICSTAFADPEELRVFVKETSSPDAVWIGDIPVATGTYTTVTRVWAHDENGHRVAAADFARLVGDAELASRIERYRDGMKGPTLVGLAAGAGAWAGGAALAISARETGDAGPGLALVIGGQAAVVWALVTRNRRRIRSTRIDPWYSVTEADERARAYGS